MPILIPVNQDYESVFIRWFIRGGLENGPNCDQVRKCRIPQPIDSQDFDQFRSDEKVTVLPMMIISAR